MSMRSFMRLSLAAAAGLACTSSALAQSDESRDVGLITISGSVSERPGPFDWLRGEGTTTVRSLIRGVEKAVDDDLDALVVRLEDASLTPSQIEEIGVAMQDASDEGVEVIVVAEGMGPAEIRLGAHADRVIAQSGSGLTLPGMYMEEMYLADMFEWIGVKPSFVQVGDYKGANETMTRTGPSDAWDQNISQLLDSLYGNMLSGIADGRDMTTDGVEAAMDKAWFATVDDGVELGLVDDAIRLSDLKDMLSGKLGGDLSWKTNLVSSDSGVSFDPNNPFAMLAMLSRDPANDPDDPTIAVIHIDGPIVDGDSAQGGLFGSSSVGSRTIRRIASDLKDDDMVKGVVVRINSPGGSATASEVIWQALQDLSGEKPVYVSVGSMAASGGYYIAVAGERIFVNPSSIVGSIGVVGGKLAIEGVYDKLKLNVVSRARGPRAALFGSAAWTDTELEVVREKMQETYDLFTSRVSEGREGIELDKTAEGRLFTGDKAIGLMMADEIGSLTDAIESLAGEVGLQDYDVLDYPGPQSLEDFFDQLVPAGVSSPAISVNATGPLQQALQTIVGPNWEAVKQRIDAAVMLRNAPVTVLDHRVLLIK